MSLEISEENKVLIPTLTWYHVKDFVILSYEVYNSTEKNILITDNNILLNVLSNNNEYKMEFELYNEINSNDSSYVIDDKSVKMILKKANDDNWSSLTKDKNLYKNNIKINWNRWIDEDAEEDEVNNEGGMPENFDFQQMMQSMGGMGDMASMMQGMGGMPNMDGFEGEENDEDEGHEEDCECCVDEVEEKEVNVV